MKKLLLALMSLSTVAYAECNWPSVNHDLHNTRSNPCETTLNIQNVGTLVVKDSITLANAVQGAPAILDGRLYFGDTGGTVYARHANDLSTVYWTKTLSGPVDAPVTVVGNVVYVATGDIKLHALDINTGDELPGFPVVVDPNNVIGADILAGPVVVDNIVIVPTVDGTPPAFGTDVTPSRHQSISAFNATTGALKWRRVIQPLPLGAQGGSFSTAAIDSDLKRLYIGTSNADDIPVGDQTDALLCLDYRTGEEIWSYQFTADDAWGALYPCDPDGDVGASPNLFQINAHGQNVKVVGVASKMGVYKVFDRVDGTLIWENDTVPSGWHFISTTAPGAAYDQTTGYIYVPVLIDNTDEPYQALTILSSNGNTGASNILNSINYGSARFQITALDANNGNTVWKQAFPIIGSGSVSGVNGVVYFTNWYGEVYALNGYNGNVLFHDTTTFPPYTFLGAATAVANGKLYVPVGIYAVPGGGFTIYGLP